MVLFSQKLILILQNQRLFTPQSFLNQIARVLYIDRRQRQRTPNRRRLDPLSGAYLILIIFFLFLFCEHKLFDLKFLLLFLARIVDMECHMRAVGAISLFFLTFVWASSDADFDSLVLFDSLFFK